MTSVMRSSHSSEKPSVVLDVGTSYTRAGYAGDSVPICIVPTHNQGIWLRDLHDTEELRCGFRAFLRNIYLRQLLLSMNERPVIVCESLICPIRWREAIADVLFVDFGVPSVIFAPRHLLALNALGISTGLVVHSGYSETTVLPVYENLVLLNAWQSLPIGGKAIEDSLFRLLSELSNSVDTFSDDSLLKQQLEDIKVRVCFMSPYERAVVMRAVSSGEQAGGTTVPNPPKDVSYPLSGDAVLKIPGVVRESASEVMYDHDGCEQTLAHLLLNSIHECPLDTRKPLANNIVLVGGSAMLPGFKKRLHDELMALCETDRYREKMFIKKFCFHALPVKENYMSWLGGSILGSCGNLEAYSVTRQQYESSGHLLPDWSTFSPSQESSSPLRTI